jgi:hypothetical protein
MMRWLLLRPYLLAEVWVRHPNWAVRRVAQAVALSVAVVWLALPKARGRAGEGGAANDPLADTIASSSQLREFLHGTAIGKPLVGHICRILVLRLSVHTKTRELASSEGRNFALRVGGPVDQRMLRNLLVWQNHVLPPALGEKDDSQVDMALLVAGQWESDERLFDLFSIALMLERVRSFAVFWNGGFLTGAAPVLPSEQDLLRRRTAAGVTDLANIPPDMLCEVARRGTRGGVKLLQFGRKHANDFLKLALPGRFVVAVGLRECEDGTVEPQELELWLGLIAGLHARDPELAFVVLNCLTPSQWRQWPAHLRFARHQGLSLQDTICLAQVADGYLGVLDVAGLAAHSAGRPGIYVPLEDADCLGSERVGGNPGASQIMVGSRRRADIGSAVAAFAGFARGNGPA